MTTATGTVLLYDKPAGVTSHDVVAKVRRERGVKAGHAGTLDPFATGLLLILLGPANRGEVVETPARDVQVHRAELLSSDGEYAHFEIECSAGTYIRTLVETLEDAYCSDLRRTAVGPFRVEDAGEELPAERVAELVPAVAEALR